MRLRGLILALSATLVLAGCGQREEGPGPEMEVVLGGLSDTEWTYFSFESGEVVGCSAFLDEAADAAWAARRDWDFAVCGEYLRTNSGDSGCGLGGVQRDSLHNYLQISKAPRDGYLSDRTGPVAE